LQFGFDAGLGPHKLAAEDGAAETRLAIANAARTDNEIFIGFTIAGTHLFVRMLMKG
jgi:hypothetical protein